MAVTEAERLRQLLGEAVPPGGSEADTLFTDDTIVDLLTRYPVLEDAAREGWKIKASHFANLVNTNESGTSRSLSSLHEHALKMAAFFGGPSQETANQRGRVRIHKIRRAEE